MSYRIEDFVNDPKWKQSFGEKLGKIHYRNKNWHAEFEPSTGYGDIHYDEIDPTELVASLLKHMYQSKTGKEVLIAGAGLLLDQILTGGKVRKSIIKSLFG